VGCLFILAISRASSARLHPHCAARYANCLCSSDPRFRCAASTSPVCPLQVPTSPTAPSPSPASSAWLPCRRRKKWSVAQAPATSRRTGRPSRLRGMPRRRCPTMWRSILRDRVRWRTGASLTATACGQRPTALTPSRWSTAPSRGRTARSGSSRLSGTTRTTRAQCTARCSPPLPPASTTPTPATRECSTGVRCGTRLMVDLMSAGSACKELRTAAM